MATSGVAGLLYARTLIDLATGEKIDLKDLISGGGGGIPDTDSVDKPMSREKGKWVEAVEQAPDDGKVYVRDGWGWRNLNRTDWLVPTTTGKIEGDVASFWVMDGTKDSTITFTGLPPYRAMIFTITVNGSGGDFTWPGAGTILWNGGTPPVLGATRTVIDVYWDGLNLTGKVSISVP